MSKGQTDEVGRQLARAMAIIACEVLDGRARDEAERLRREHRYRESRALGRTVNYPEAGRVAREAR